MRPVESIVYLWRIHANFVIWLDLISCSDFVIEDE